MTAGGVCPRQRNLRKLSLDDANCTVGRLQVARRFGDALYDLSVYVPEYGPPVRKRERLPQGLTVANSVRGGKGHIRSCHF
jgi:hypothetical protein